MKMEDELRNYKSELEAQLKEIESLITLNNKNLARLKNLPEFGVKASTVRGCHQYYLIDKDTGKRKYAGKEKLKLVKKLIQRDYAVATDKKLVDLRNRLDRFISNYDICEVEALYEKLPDARKSMVIPVIEPDDCFIKRWYEAHPGQQNTYHEDGIYQTNRGDMVRSKSEKIIADTLEKYKIPYQYEPMLELGYNTVYPDFVALNVRTRKTLYWEHLGIVSDIEYATKNFKKIQNYEKHGYLLGKNLITTMESEDIPIDVKLVERKIKEFLL
ncbi:hypothetical protein SAMN04487831_102175 [Pseudobutyrivibrio sp. UC1225]|nr:hypothetical protein SAMN04487831_102175 [Pseudobutyrivibrio sp. UC1225]